LRDANSENWKRAEIPLSSSRLGKRRIRTGSTHLAKVPYLRKRAIKGVGIKTELTQEEKGHTPKRNKKKLAREKKSLEET